MILSNQEIIISCILSKKWTGKHFNLYIEIIYFGIKSNLIIGTRINWGLSKYNITLSASITKNTNEYYKIYITRNNFNRWIVVNELSILLIFSIYMH